MVYRSLLSLFAGLFLAGCATSEVTREEYSSTLYLFGNAYETDVFMSEGRIFVDGKDCGNEATVRYPVRSVTFMSHDGASRTAVIPSSESYLVEVRGDDGSRICILNRPNGYNEKIYIEKPTREKLERLGKDEASGR